MAGTRKWVFGVMVLACTIVGCSIQIGVGNGNDNSAPSQKVTIRFENTTLTAAVDVEFFATNDELDMLPDDLFVDEYEFNENIGVAGSGLIEPMSADEIEFDCTDNLVVGTTGGTFLHNQSGNELGTGTQIVAQESLLGLCNGTVTFRYEKEGDVYRTRLLIE